MNMIPATIIDIQYYLPLNKIDNNYFAKFIPNLSIDFINNKLGIDERSFISESETCGSMAIQAGEKTLQKYPFYKDSIDLLIIVTQTPDYQIPGIAPIVQHKLNLRKNIAAYDINLACSGFPYALSIAATQIALGLIRECLIITSEAYSSRINLKDKTVATLFGDAASSTLIGRSNGSSGFLAFDFGTDGSNFDKLMVPAGGTKIPHSNQTKIEVQIDEGIIRSQENLLMEGKEIYQFVLDQVPTSIDNVFSKSGLSKEDIKYFVFHQANKYMLQALQKKLGIASEKVIIDINKYGNTVSSTIPIVLSNLMNRNSIQPGDNVLLCGFGVGLSWSTCIYKY